jgi:hypothetical protein
MSHHQTAGHNCNINRANKPFKNAAEFKYLCMTVTNQNFINEEIKSRLNLWNACYYSVQNRSSSCLLSKNVNNEIYKVIILPAALYGCETWSLMHQVHDMDHWQALVNTAVNI